MQCIFVIFWKIVKIQPKNERPYTKSFFVRPGGNMTLFNVHKLKYLRSKWPKNALSVHFQNKVKKIIFSKKAPSASFQAFRARKSCNRNPPRPKMLQSTTPFQAVEPSLYLVLGRSKGLGRSPMHPGEQPPSPLLTWRLWGVIFNEKLHFMSISVRKNGICRSTADFRKFSATLGKFVNRKRITYGNLCQ